MVLRMIEAKHGALRNPDVVFNANLGRCDPVGNAEQRIKPQRFRDYVVEIAVTAQAGDKRCLHLAMLRDGHG